MKTMRIGLVGLVGALGGFALQACFTPQPAPECQVNAATGRTFVQPYFVKLTKVSGDAPCDAITHTYMGMQRFHPPGTTEFTVGYRAGILVDMINGDFYSANSDTANDCVAGEACDICVEDDAARATDGGLITPSGEVVLCPDGTGLCDDIGGDPCYSLVDGNECTASGVAVDVTNTCELVPDPVTRSDPADPGPRSPGALPPAGRCPVVNGVQLKEPCPKFALGYGEMTQFPDAKGICTITENAAAAAKAGAPAEHKGSAKQDFRAETIDLVDGGTQVFPAETVKLEWTDFGVYNTAKIPFTAFKANLKVTEGACVANYKALGFAPPIPCNSDGELRDGGNDQCDPFPRDPTLPDGGLDPTCGNRFNGSCAWGSGVSPLFKPRCNLQLGVCEPTVDLDTL